MMEIRRSAALITLIFLTIPAAAQDIVEVRLPTFEDRTPYWVYYWCLDQPQIPDVYHGPEYNLQNVLIEVPAVVMGTRRKNTIFLTTDECLEQTRQAAEQVGVDPDELKYLNITP